MINDIITSILDNFHEIGHLGNDVDAMMDSVLGMGHRIKWGHDLQGLINAFHLDGVSGIYEWFDHIMKDLTTEHGIPLPFANAIRIITGMEMDEAIEWLCINAADFLETGTWAAFVSFLKKNPTAYKAALVLGALAGVADHNPLLIAYNGIMLARELKIAKDLLKDTPVQAAFEKITTIASKTAMFTAAVDVGFGLAGVDLAALIADIFDSIDAFDVISGGGEVAADIIDGLATMGISLIISRAIRFAFKKINEGKEELLKEKISLLELINTLKASAAYLSPAVLSRYLQELMEKGLYKGQLQV